MFKGKAVVFALMLMLATSVYANMVDGCTSQVGTDNGLGTLAPAQLTISICPQGDFEYIRASAGGSTAYVWIIALDFFSYPVVGIPWTDCWLNSCNASQQLHLCAMPIAADSLTGDNGRTTFSGRIAGGGCTLTGGIWWAIQGVQIKGNKPTCDVPLCLDIIVKSPDLSGGGGNPDGIVNLSDLIPFGNAYNLGLGAPGYNACCDLNDDDKCNLSDFTFFGMHYQHTCF